MKKKKRNIVYGQVHNNYVWVALSPISNDMFLKGICLQQFERAIGRSLRDREKIQFRLEEL